TNLFGNSTVGSMANDALNGFLNATIGNFVNDIFGLITGIGGEGKAANMSETKVIPERQLWLSQTVQLIFNVVEYVVSYAIIVLTAWQLVVMCYLFLLGPIAASFYVWPSGVGNALFRNVFATWIDAITVLCLWRFYWCVILAVATQRIIW